MDLTFEENGEISFWPKVVREDHEIYYFQQDGSQNLKIDSLIRKFGIQGLKLESM